MLKEERVLRGYLIGGEYPMNASLVRSMITALVRAVREDCAKVADQGKLFENRDMDIAAAIRGKK